VLPATESDRVAVAGTDYEGENSDATLALVEEPESSGEGTTTTVRETTTAADGTTTTDVSTTDPTADGTATSDDGGAAADESTADGLDGFGVAAAVAGLTTALGYRTRRNSGDD
jgi:hypothetical protein